MKKNLLRLGLMSLMLILAFIAKAQTSVIKEKALYTTDFTDWKAVDRKKATNEVVELKTRYSNEAFTFTLNGVGISPKDTKFADHKGFMQIAKYTGEYSAAEPSAVTSALANITKITLHQAATGGKRGIKISAKGDGDADWVVLHNKSIVTSSGEDLTIEVNRKNCQLKFENFTLDQNAYVTDLCIYGNVELSGEDIYENYTLTYYNIDGETVLGTQTVQEDSRITAFLEGMEEKVTVAEGKKFRGWGTSLKADEKKYTVNDVVKGNLKLYALVTDIETASPTARYDFNLQMSGFCADDHEAFCPEGKAKWHSTQHGWTFSADDKIKLLMGGKGYIKMNLCAFSAGNITLTDPKGNAVGSIEAKAGKDGAMGILQNPSTESGEYILSFDGTAYLHNLSIVNMTDPSFTQEGNWYTVKAGDAQGFISALETANGANAAADAPRSYIFLPNGTYDLGEACLTTISGNNISLIGESMDKTIIVNKPEIEGIGVTATILNTGKNLYIQDLTLQNAYDYYNAKDAGRAICLQDRGSQTICKKVKMLSYQDTYYSNDPQGKGQYYFEDSEIHGTVDYICGGGDAYFNRVLLVNESRNASGKSGDDVIAAPNSKSEWGYIFKDCTIENKAARFSLGRSWDNITRLTWLNTTINQKDEINDDGKKVSYFTIDAMGNNAADKFRLDFLKDADGNVFSPSEKMVTFKATKASITKPEENIILTADEAAGYTLDKVFTNWTPAALASQKDPIAAKVANGKLTWTGDADMYMIEKNGEFTALTSETSYDIDDASAKYEVRAANEMGGFGLSESTATGIDKVISSDDAIKTVIYSVDGMQLSHLQKGINILVKTFADGSKKTSKVIVR